MGSILMTKAVCWVTPSKVMVVRSFEVVAAYVLQVRSKCLPIRRKSSFQVTVFDVPSHWTDILGTGAIISAVLGELSYLLVCKIGKLLKQRNLTLDGDDRPSLPREFSLNDISWKKVDSFNAAQVWAWKII